MTSHITSQKPKIPKLRFPEFSGEWEEKRLGKICEYRNGGSFESKVLENSKYFLITLNSIDIRGDLKASHKTVPCADWYLKKNDLVMVLSDVAHGNFLGLVDIIPDDDKFVLNQRMGLLRKNDKTTYLRFLRTYINNRQKYFKLHGQGSSQQNLSKGDILKFLVNKPTLPEQQKIASFLTSVDEWISNLKAKKESLEQYKKGMMQKLFSQQIRFKDENGNEFPDWEEKRLGEVAEIVGGGTPDTTKEEYWNGTVNWYTPSEIKSKYAGESARKITDLGVKKSSAKILPIGSILFTSRATIGEVSISTQPTTTNQGFQSLIVNRDNSNSFFYYWIIFSKKEFMQKANGSTFLEISSNEMKKIKGLFPQVKEQLKIADFLTSIDTLINSKQLQISKAEEWKRGLMQGLFV